MKQETIKIVFEQHASNKYLAWIANGDYQYTIVSADSISNCLRELALHIEVSDEIKLKKKK